MDRRKITVLFMLVFTILLSSFAFYAYQVVSSPNILIGQERRELIVAPDDTFKSLQNKLYDRHYVNDLVSFSLLARIMKYDKYMKPGRYLLEADMSNLEAIRLLRSGNQAPVKITFNNIRLMEDLGERITANLMIGKAEFDVALIRFISKSNVFDEYSIISMFVPNTYEVYYNVTGDELVEKMRAEFYRFWNSARMEKAKSLGLSPAEVVTLASIVNAESVKREESKIIAGLYINRLKRGIPLQADPTLVFANGDFSLKRVLNEHKEVDSPYNTYKNKGLPPGPVNMPPIAVIDAVLNYAKHNYIYMCAKEDFSGYHYFAETYAEHEANARRYQRRLSEEQRKARLKK